MAPLKGKQGRLFYYKMELYILGIGIKELKKGKVWENKFGQMVHYTKGSGWTTRQMVREDWFIQMETYIKVIGWMIKQKGMVYMHI